MTGLMGLKYAAFAGMMTVTMAFIPMSTDFDAWYGGFSLFCLAQPIVLALWAGWVALAGQPLFKDILDEK